MSKRKPHNDISGYVCERKSYHPKLPGHFVVIDRKNGGDWIHAESRWVLMHMDGQKCKCFVSVTDRKSATDLMKEIANGVDVVDLGQYQDEGAP